MLGVRRARVTRVNIIRRMDLWERGQHAGLVGDAEVEGDGREIRAASGKEEEDKTIARSYDDTVLFQSTDIEGGRVSPPG